MDIVDVIGRDYLNDNLSTKNNRRSSVNSKMEAPSKKRTIDSFFAPSAKKARLARPAEDAAVADGEIRTTGHGIVSQYSYVRILV